MIAPYLASCLVNLLKPENTSQFKIIKDPNSIWMNVFLINECVPVSLYSNLLTFRDSNKSFIIDRDLLQTVTNYDFDVSHSNPQHQKLIYEFGKEIYFNIKQKERKGNTDKTLKKLLKSPAVTASGISNTIFLPSNADDLCDRLTLILQKKHARNNSNIINVESVAIVDKLLEYKCMSKEQHKQTLKIVI